MPFKYFNGQERKIQFYTPAKNLMFASWQNQFNRINKTVLRGFTSWYYDKSQHCGFVLIIIRAKGCESMK